MVYTQAMQGEPITKQLQSITFTIYANKIKVSTRLQTFLVIADRKDYISELMLDIIRDEVCCLDDLAGYTNKSNGRVRWVASNQ